MKKYFLIGNYQSIGDRAGRLIIFQKKLKKGSKKTFEYKYYIEIQSHMKEFDFLK